MTKKLNVLYQSDDNFVVPLMVSMTSLLQNNQDMEQLDLYIIDHGISDENKALIKRLCDAYMRKLFYINSISLTENLKRLNIVEQQNGSYTTFCKIFCCSYLQMLDEILYIDADTLILDSLADLANMELDGYACAMVNSAMNNVVKAYLDVKEYYNGGVIFLNFDYWRKYDIQKMFSETIESDKRFYYTLVGDESLFNVVLKNQIKKMPLRYNFESSWWLWGWNRKIYKQLGWQTGDEYYTIDEIKAARNNPCIAHYINLTTGRPWEYLNDNPFRKEFSDYKKLLEKKIRKEFCMYTRNRMNIFEKLLFSTGHDIKKNEYLWNSIAGCISAIEMVVCSIFTSRYAGYSQTGMLSIGFAIGNLLISIGKYGIRPFQTTDVKRKYVFSEYFYARLISISVMILATLLYLLFGFFNKNYSIYKLLVVALVCFKVEIEAFEDVFAGECQLIGRLDVASKVLFARKVSFLVLFCAGLIITKDFLLVLLIAVALSTMIDGALLFIIIKRIEIRLILEQKQNVIKILFECFPLFLSAFYCYYVANGPKYVIDAVMSDEIQAYYTFIAFPVFAIELVNNFIYQPLVVGYANDWKENRFLSLSKKIYKQVLIIIILTMLFVLGGYICGIQILSFMFSTNLIQYKTEMLILLLSGGFLAVIGFLSTVLITMRYSILMIAGYTVVSFISMFAYKAAVKNNGIMGAAVTCVILFASFAVYELSVITLILRRYCKHGAQTIK